MSLLDARTTSDAVKLLIFIVVTTLATSLLVVTIGNITFGDTKQYKAVFSDATGVVNGDDVRIAGVKVGNVEDIEIFDQDKAVVTFKVDSDSQLTASTNATIRYRNLVGQRYIALTPGVGSPSIMREGDTIPLKQTSPALDLTVLFNGFKPLFEALSPADINKLSYEIITVFQGEGGTLESLLAHTASVTSTLAGRDKIIGELITNLNQVMVTLGNRDEELSDLLIQLRTFVSGLSQDREAILGSLESISDLAARWPAPWTGTMPRSTVPFRSCRSSWTRSAAPRRTAPGSTSTCATSTDG
jgi:phospholipid/cholesterol/gamma-HCH transport system substrate-binding protein